MSDMTRKEAIKELKDLKQYCKDTFLQRTLNLYLNALNMAIASLETDEAYDLMYEQPELCEDCISRKNIIHEIINQEVPVVGKVEWLNGHAMRQEQILKLIEEMPSVLPKANKPKEKWILKNYDTSVLKIECPICGFHRNILNKTLAKFNYCPNCGADMRTSEE